METTTTTQAENTELQVHVEATPASENVTPVTDTTTTKPNEAEETKTAVAETTPAAEIPKAETPKLSFEELLKQHGYDSELELLKSAKQRQEQEQKEADKPYEQSKEFAEAVEFASKHKLATSDEFLTQKQINAEKDEVLAFNKFKSEFTPDEDEKALSEEDLAQVIKDKFNEKYDLDSENERLKKAGLQEIKAIADEIRKPLNDKLEGVKKKMVVASMHQQHSKAFEEFAKNPIKTTVEFKDEKGESVSLEVESGITLTKEEVDAYLKDPQNTPVFNEILNSFIADREAGDKAYGAFLQSQQDAKIKETQLKTIAQKAYELGLSKAKELSIGATAPFNSKESASPNNGNKDEPLRQYSGGKFV